MFTLEWPRRFVPQLSRSSRVGLSFRQINTLAMGICVLSISGDPSDLGGHPRVNESPKVKVQEAPLHHRWGRGWIRSPHFFCTDMELMPDGAQLAGAISLCEYEWKENQNIQTSKCFNMFLCKLLRSLNPLGLNWQSGQVLEYPQGIRKLLSKIYFKSKQTQQPPPLTCHLFIYWYSTFKKKLLKVTRDLSPRLATWQIRGTGMRRGWGRQTGSAPPILT